MFRKPKQKPLSFVLVHGAFHGGWCWQDVANKLRDQGHRVTSPTLSGLGEKSHLLSKSIGFETMVADITNHIRFEQLADVILVGHSFGGAIISAVVEQIPEQIDKLIYVDALLPEGDKSLFDLLSPAIVAERRRTATEKHEGLAIPCPPASVFGLEVEAQVKAVESRLTPHPLRSYEDTVKLKYPPGALKTSHYIYCTQPSYSALQEHFQRAQSLGWPIHRLETGHDCMISAPSQTADLLLEIARTTPP